jgi:GT2 family glycosyltransferase
VIQNSINTVGVVIATAARRQIVVDTILSLARLKSVPGCVVVVGSSAKDLPDIDCKLPFPLHLLVSSQMGSAIQRNQGVRKIGGTVKYVSFLDDDMEVHQDYFMEVERVFDSDHRIAGFSGMIVVNGNINRIAARTILDQHQIHPEMPCFGFYPKKWPGFYGCSMNVRRDLLQLEEFDERLPLYAIGEDCEMGFRLSRYGDVGGSARCPAVHLATKSGRISELGVGYAQIINYLYFTHKGIGFPKIKTYWEKLVQTTAINLFFLILPCLDRRNGVDRKGRFQGNLLAIKDVLQGKIDPLNLIKVIEKKKT